MNANENKIDTLNARLERIEDKVDRLAESLITVARVEERIATMLADQANINKRLNKHSDRLDNVEDGLLKTQGVSRVAERLFWLVMTAAVALYMGASS
ncbi:MAG: hypothetical protein Unbinned4098contig1000_24 [Prokaryotic dsDNA virus sp.]|nr:MAG: hypothetical protein Unbinned4098contig1000_24 [Prokaryotic dsDNA virus sp.]|tara:strand:- start:4439 stop:4732 length:294 start_codon:yes stop_codon:yes gene_type:complete